MATMYMVEYSLLLPNRKALNNVNLMPLIV